MAADIQNGIGIQRDAVEEIGVEVVRVTRHRGLSGLLSQSQVATSFPRTGAPIGDLPPQRYRDVIPPPLRPPAHAQLAWEEQPAAARQSDAAARKNPRSIDRR